MFFFFFAWNISLTIIYPTRTDCFDSVTCVLFVVSISEYDQTLREGKENRMLESLALFDDICNSKWFQNTAFILFLNKTDLFQKKIGNLCIEEGGFDLI